LGKSDIRNPLTAKHKIMIGMKKIKLFFTFYKSFCLVSIFISLVCAYSLFKLMGKIPIYSFLFWFKIISSALIFFYIKEYKSKEFYFYKNFGISKIALWIFSFIVDFTIYFVVIIIAFKLNGKFA